MLKSDQSGEPVLPLRVSVLQVNCNGVLRQKKYPPCSIVTSVASTTESDPSGVLRSFGALIVIGPGDASTLTWSGNATAAAARSSVLSALAPTTLWTILCVSSGWPFSWGIGTPSY